jgi:hypothetical protein
MKVCCKCKENKEEILFSAKAKNKDGLQSECKACHSIYVRNHYLANVDYYVMKARVGKVKQFKLLKEKLSEYLWMHPCVDCGEPDPVVLEFDHVRGIKTGNVSVMVYSHGLPWCRILTEIEKCDVRCANCHRRKTSVQFGWHGYPTLPEVQSLRKV